MGNLPCEYLRWISVGGTWLGGDLTKISDSTSSFALLFFESDTFELLSTDGATTVRAVATNFFISGYLWVVQRTGWVNFPNLHHSGFAGQGGQLAQYTWKALLSLTFYFSSVHSLHLPESNMYMRFFYCFFSRVQQVVFQKRWHRIFQYRCSCSQKELLQHWKNQYESCTHQLNAVQRMGWFRRWYASLVDEL